MVNFKSKHDYCVLTNLKTLLLHDLQNFRNIKNDMKGHIIDTKMLNL